MSNLSLFQSKRSVSPAENQDETKAAIEVAAHLIGDTAHDLRAPLSTARELARLVADGELGEISPDQRDHLNAIVQRCNDMSRLIDDMLQFEGVSNGMPRTYRCWISPIDLSTAVDPLIRPSLEDRSVRLNWTGFGADQPLCFGDFDKLKRLLLNLIGNANQATAEGGIIDVSLTISDSRDRMRFTVHDQGRGMETAEIEQLAHRGTSRTGGYGLGLAICRQIAALHFTQIEVESALGVGSSFSFDLPIGGPVSVLDSFVRYRESWLPDRVGAASAIRARMRPSHRRKSVTRRQLPAEIAAPEYPFHVSMVSAQAIGSLSQNAAMELDRFLQSQCRLHELVYRVEHDQWMLLMDVSLGRTDQRVDNMLESLKQVRDSTIAHQHLEWCGPISSTIGTVRDRRRLQEAFLRGSLSIDRPHDEEVVQCSPQSSETALRRLDAEVRWITNKFKDRQRRLRDQASSARHTH